MSLNRSALSLSSGPRGVQEARRWVVAACHEMGRDDLAGCAELGVSELVTNALLHAEGPIDVRMRGTQEHPRVEVRDASTYPPVVPPPPAETFLGTIEAGDVFDDDDLLTFGRGLNIVSRASDAWGAEIEDDGKTVWFVPAHGFSHTDGPTGRISGANCAIDVTGELPADLMEFVLVGVPVKDYLGFQRHFRELRREARLLALAHGSDYPLARDLSEVFVRIGRPLRIDQTAPEIGEAQASGHVTVDLCVVMSRDAARDVSRFIELLELTDVFAREEKMLSLARDDAQRAFQSWFLGELVRQGHGAVPLAWSRAISSAPRARMSSMR